MVSSTLHDIINGFAVRVSYLFDVRFDLLQMAIERANVAWCSEAPVPRAPRSMWEVFEDALQGKSAEPIAVDPDFNQTRSCTRRKCLPWM